MSKKEPQIKYVITNSGTISLFIDGKPHTIATTHINYGEIVSSLIEKDYTKLLKMLDFGASLEDRTGGCIRMVGKAIYWNEHPIQNSITDRIIQFAQNGQSFKPIMKFLEKMYSNKEEAKAEELYRFLEANGIPLTEDGCFLANKRVRSDFKDFYTGKIDNSVGKVVKMDRELVNADSNQTCSTGLHFCSLAYLQHYHGGEGVIIVVKVDPVNVVSIPTDYQNTKGRCCEYTVVSVYRDEVDPSKEIFDSNLYEEDGKTPVQKKAKVNFWNVRDAKGHFVKREATRKLSKPTVSAPVRYHNVRDAKGHFVKKSSVEVVKPVTQKFHNVRDAKGKFVKCVAGKKKTYGVKPNGDKYHNVRGAGGKFVKSE